MNSTGPARKLLSGTISGFGWNFGPRLRSFAAVALVSVMFPGLEGCSGFFTAINNTSTTTGSTTYVYVTNVDSSGSGGTLTAYTLTSGVLTAISGSPIALAATPTSIVVAPNNAFLYVGTTAGVFLYTIGTGGVLTEGYNDTIVSALAPTAMVIDSTSSWLIIANGTTTLDGIPLTATTGVPTGGNLETVAIPAATSTTSVITQHAVFSPANNQIFVTLGASGTAAVGFAASSATPFGSEITIPLHSGSTSANAVTVNSTSAFVYIAEATATTGIVRGMSTAKLGADLFTPLATGEGPSAMLADATDAYVYVANQTDSTISGYALTLTTGGLTALTDSPFVAAKSPLGLAEDSTKAYVLDIGYGLNPNLWINTFDTTNAGTLDLDTTTSTADGDPSYSNGIAVSH